MPRGPESDVHRALAEFGERMHARHVEMMSRLANIEELLAILAKPYFPQDRPNEREFTGRNKHSEH